MTLGAGTVKELQKYLLTAEGFGIWTGGGWQERNLPSGNERVGTEQPFVKIGECPHTELLVRIADIIGVDRAAIDEYASRFCGQHVREVDDLAPLSGRRGTEYHPDSFCNRLYLVLSTISHLESLEEIPLDIRPDGSLRVLLEASSIEEMDKLYQKIRQSVIKTHFASLMPKISGEIVELLNIFGQEIDIRHTRWFQTAGQKGMYFIPSKGCPVAPKDDFSGIMS